MSPPPGSAVQCSRPITLLNEPKAWFWGFRATEWWASLGWSWRLSPSPPVTTNGPNVEPQIGTDDSGIGLWGSGPILAISRHGSGLPGEAFRAGVGPGTTHHGRWGIT